MGRITQYQRRAIESLWQGISEEERTRISWPKPISKDELRFFYKGKEVYFLGVSTGEGTCADIWGLDVAVFGNFGEKPSRPIANSRHNLETSRFAVLVRKPTPEEWNDPTRPHLVVELLYVAGKMGNSVRLASYKGLKNVYCYLA